VSCAKTAEPIELPLRLLSRMDQGNQSINQSIILKWPKWHSQCQDHRLGDGNDCRTKKVLIVDEKLTVNLLPTTSVGSLFQMCAAATANYVLDAGADASALRGTIGECMAHYIGFVGWAKG